MQPGTEGLEQYRLRRIQTGRITNKFEADERSLNDIPLDQSSEGDRTDKADYPGAWKLASITVVLCMAIFLVALVRLLLSTVFGGSSWLFYLLGTVQDTTIVAAATPRITDHFKKLEDGT